jgi:hypothetical protein
VGGQDRTPAGVAEYEAPAIVEIYKALAGMASYDDLAMVEDNEAPAGDNDLAMVKDYEAPAGGTDHKGLAMEVIKTPPVGGGYSKKPDARDASETPDVVDESKMIDEGEFSEAPAGGREYKIPALGKKLPTKINLSGNYRMYGHPVDKGRC